MKRYAFLFPGQGAQYPGMGKDFYEAFAVARETFEEADDLLGRSLSKLIFEGPKEELTLTKNSQVAIYVVSMAILRTVISLFPSLKPSVCAGLSLGEYTALTAAEKISFSDCLKLVAVRGQCMQDACEKESGSMSVVIGSEVAFIQEVLKTLPDAKVWIANLNCPGQVVIAGTLPALELAAAALKEKGVKRVLPLEVSGAFHTPLMHSAKEVLSPYIDAVSFQEGISQVVMNVPGSCVTDLGNVKNLLKEQVVSPVYWEKGIRSIEADLFLEMGPGTTLAGMNKRIGVVAPTLSIEKTGNLEELYALT